jgi:hypothetical protein
MTTLTSAQFGQGTLISEENGKANIQFSCGIKSLIVKFAHLTCEDGSEFVGSTGDVVIEAKPVSKYNHKGRTAEEKHAEKMSITAHSNYDRFELHNWYDEHQEAVKHSCLSSYSNK